MLITIMPPPHHWKYFQQLKLKTLKILKTWNQRFQFCVPFKKYFQWKRFYLDQPNIFLSLFLIFTENENENEQTKRTLSYIVENAYLYIHSPIR